MVRKVYPVTGSLGIGDVLMSTNTALSSKTWVRANGSFYTYADYPQYWAFRNPSYDGSPIVMTNGLSPESSASRGRVITLNSSSYLKVYGVYGGYNHGVIYARVVDNNGSQLAQSVLIDDVYMWSGDGSGERSGASDWDFYDPKNKILVTRTKGESSSAFICFVKASGSGTSWSLSTNSSSNEYGIYGYANSTIYRHPFNADAYLIYAYGYSAYSNPSVAPKIVSYNPTNGSISEVSNNVATSSTDSSSWVRSDSLWLDPVTGLYWARARMTYSSPSYNIFKWVKVNTDLTLTNATPPDENRLQAQTLVEITVTNRLRTDHLGLAGSGGVVIDPANDRYFRMDEDRNVTAYQYSTHNRLPQYDTKIYPMRFDSNTWSWVGDVSTGYFLAVSDPGNSSTQLYAGINKNTNPTKITFQVPSLSFSGVTTYVKASS